MIHAIGIPGGAEIIVILLVLVLPYILNIVALIEVLRNEFEPSQNKLIWLIVVLVIPFLGAVLYFLMGRKGRIKLDSN